MSKQVILVYTTDVWHTRTSEEIIAVASSKEKAIQLCLEHSRDEGNELNEEQLELLSRIYQTQGHSGDFEYYLEGWNIDEL